MYKSLQVLRPNVCIPNYSTKIIYDLFNDLEIIKLHMPSTTTRFKFPFPIL